jgi:hypothetical protein
MQQIAAPSGKYNHFIDGVANLLSANDAANAGFDCADHIELLRCRAVFQNCLPF